MPARPRARRRPRAERVQGILDAARAVFSEAGYEGASMAEIAARAGVVEGTLYKHFESKRALLEQVLKDFYEPLIDDVERHIAGIAGARNRLRYIVWRQLTALAEDRGLCALVLREVRPDPAFYRSAVQGLNRRYTALAMRVLQQGSESGELDPDLDPALIRDLIYGGIEHAGWRLLFGRGNVDVDRLADALTGALFRGIARPRPETEAAARLEAVTDRLEALARRSAA